MPSSWIITRATKDGGKRYRVEYRLGGRESAHRYGGSFRNEARGARRAAAGSTASSPRCASPTFARSPSSLSARPTLAEAASGWRASRRRRRRGDPRRCTASRSTACSPILGARRVDEITAADVADLVADARRDGLRSARRSARPSRTSPRCSTSPASTRTRRATSARAAAARGAAGDSTRRPPTHVEAVYRLLPRRYRLPLLWLDWSGARVGRARPAHVGDYDEPRAPCPAARGDDEDAAARSGSSCRRRARRRDRARPCRRARTATPSAPLFAGVGADRVRTAIARACTAAGVPPFSPHDLRHRRISLLHRQGRPWAEIGALVGQRKLTVTADTYTHVLADEPRARLRRDAAMKVGARHVGQLARLVVVAGFALAAAPVADAGAHFTAKDRANALSLMRYTNVHSRTYSRSPTRVVESSGGSASRAARGRFLKSLECVRYGKPALANRYHRDVFRWQYTGAGLTLMVRRDGRTTILNRHR